MRGLPGAFCCSYLVCVQLRKLQMDAAVRTLPTGTLEDVIVEARGSKSREADVQRRLADVLSRTCAGIGLVGRGWGSAHRACGGLVSRILCDPPCDVQVASRTTAGGAMCQPRPRLCRARAELQASTAPRLAQERTGDRAGERIAAQSRRDPAPRRARAGDARMRAERALAAPGRPRSHLCTARLCGAPQARGASRPVP